MNVIVFSPHQDDEAFSCAGTIARHVQAADQVTIVFMTDGRLGFNPVIEGKYTQDELAARRHDEAIAAAKEMGVPKDHVLFLGYKDQELGHDAHHDKVVGRLRDIIAAKKPGVVYLAITNYGHVDHQAMYFLVFEALAASKFEGKVHVSKPHGFMAAARPAGDGVSRKFSLVDAAFPISDEIKVDISATLSKKFAAIKAHESQLGMFANLVDPADDFATALEEIFFDIYRDKQEIFELRIQAAMPHR